MRHGFDFFCCHKTFVTEIKDCIVEDSPRRRVVRARREFTAVHKRDGKESGFF
ncbi:unannotated protein [freshwater metagenome]|uniref:Unannotated protein n=1 Tax=freshwater metagenome TaxID=449393 RepID=A0A6J6EQF2_9ZZZZ